MLGLLDGSYNKDELKFINDVLVEVKERSGGSMHVSFDYDALLKTFHEGGTAESVADEAFALFDKIESGEIETKPFTEEFSDGWCGKGCECYPDPATESEADRVTRLAREAEVKKIFDKHFGG